MFEHRDVPPAGLQVPAGRLDPGETLEQGLARELDEEAGVQATRVRELGTVDGPHVGDVDSAQALHDYQAAKRAHKAEWTKMKAGAA